MLLVKSIMEFQILRWEECVRKNQYPKAVSIYTSLLNMSLAVLHKTLDEEESKKINKLWRVVMTRKITSKIKLRINNCFKNNFTLIIKGFEKLDETISSADYVSDLDKQGGFAIQDYLYPGAEETW